MASVRLMNKIDQVVARAGSVRAHYANVSAVRLVGRKTVGTSYFEGATRKVTLLRDNVWLAA